MPHDMLDSMRIDPGHRTLGELLQERQWAVQEISRLRANATRLVGRREHAPQDTMTVPSVRSEAPINPMALHQMLRLSELIKLLGLSRSTIYKLQAEKRFPAGVRLGPRAVRWRAAEVIVWQNQRAN
jgi:prophage regulatory protein